MKLKPPSKNVRIRTKTGVVVRSKLEQRVADDLTARGINYLYEKDKIPYIIPQSEHVYTPDLRIKHRDWIIECKGLLSYADQLKMLHVKASNPELDIRFVFQRDQPIRKGSKTKYSDWCKKHGFMFAFGSVPQEWINEE